MRLTLLAFLTLSLASTFAAEPTRPIIPPHKTWNQVPATPLKDSTPPKPERIALPNGLVVFLLPDNELPLIECTLILRVGDVHEDASLAGLSNAMMGVMRTGGSDTWPGDKLDTALESLAADVAFASGLETSTVSMNALKEDFPRVLDMIANVLRCPSFPEDKLKIHLTQARTAIAKRNDSPVMISGREFRRALYGKDSPYARVVEYATLAKIDRAALLNFHKNNIHPARMICGIAGDFKRDELVAALNKAFADWPSAATLASKSPPVTYTPGPRTLFVERPRINQTAIMLGHGLDLRRDHADFPAVQMMNEILSGGMAARLFTEVRTRKGLAYSVRGQATANYDRPGLFYASVLTRNEQALDAAEAVKTEIVRLRDGGVTETELAQAREGILNSQVFQYDTTAKILQQQMTYELYGYPADFTATLLARLKTVTTADIQRVAKTYLVPEKSILLGVGNTEGLPPTRSFTNVPGVEKVDVTIPAAP